VSISKKRLIVAGVVLTALATIALSFHFRWSYLELTNDHSGAVLLRARICEGEEFAVSYIHSVNISPVKEFYQILQGRIVLTAMEFETFGAGMPTTLEVGQTLTRLPEGGMRIDGFDRPISGLRYMVGRINEQVLHLRAEQIPLNTLAPAGQPIHFAFVYLNIWQRLVP